MNRRQILQSLAALALPVTAQSSALTIRPAPAVPVDWIARYLAVHGPVLQGPTTTCQACVATVAQQAVAVNVQGAPGPALSAFYAYLADTGDTTFRLPYFGGALRTAALRMNGTCTDALYPEALVLNNWQQGFPYPAHLLPSPQAHADAFNHRLLQWEHLAFGSPLGQPPDMDRINQFLLAGYPITFGFGTHAGCLMRVDAGRYWYAGFDPLQADDAYGLGRGVRPYTADALYRDGTNFVAYLEVSNAGAAPLPSQAALLAQYQASAAALTIPLTQAALDTVQAQFDLLRVGP